MDKITVRKDNTMTESTEKKEKDILAEIKESVNLDELENILINNEIVFEHNNKKYRVQKPTQKQKSDLYQAKVKKYTELIQDKSYMLEKDLIKQYKDRGIDINAIDTEILELERQKKDYKIKLGEALEKKLMSELKKLKDIIEDIKSQQHQLSIKKTSLLEISIEQQSTLYGYSYLAYLLAEVNIAKENEPDKYEKVWKSWKEYENEKDEKLLYLITFNSTLISRGEMIF
jgi:hypothetical protein